MTTKPRPPMINRAETIRRTEAEFEKRTMFSEKVEKPALQKADTEWKNACPRASSGLNLCEKAKYKSIVPMSSKIMVMRNTRQANRLRFSYEKKLIDSLKRTRSRSEIFLPRKKKKVVDRVI